MCGIAGFVGSGDLGILRRMTDAIRHRGPDAEGLWHDEETAVFLGNRRLSIVDLPGGSQPMWTGDRALGVIFNGEIYNHLDLRAQLTVLGAEFVSDHSDTEVLLHGYRHWGEAFVERLNGMWAFVIYDRLRKRLFGSRDRFGKKPFYYFHEGQTFAFASELPALLAHPAAPRSLSSTALKKYFAYCYIPAPRSIYERIWKLSPGHSCSFDLGSNALKSWRYWEYVIEPRELSSPRPQGNPDGEIDMLCEEIRARLDQAVKRRLMADVPIGVFLSGGIDSSAVTSLAARHVPAGMLNTFSIGFTDPSFDESAHARLVAGRIGTRHHEEILDLDKSLALLPEIVSRLDEPLGDSSLLPTFLLSRFTRQSVTVALGGDGGDELFAGYDPLRALRAAERYARFVPQPLHAAIRFLVGRIPVSHANLSFDFKLKRSLLGLSYPPQVWNAVWMSALDPRELCELFQEPIPIEDLYSEAIDAWDRCAQTNLVDRSLQFWTNLYLSEGILQKIDRASMMCSLEARSPFLDIEFVDLARRIPHQLKLRNGETKWILKRALQPLLTRKTTGRPKKGFGMPIGRWLRESRLEFDVSPPVGLNREFILHKLARHLHGRSDERLFLWSYWLLARWLAR